MPARMWSRLHRAPGPNRTKQNEPVPSDPYRWSYHAAHARASHRYPQLIAPSVLLEHRFSPTTHGMASWSLVLG
jgi:hypothetical protein